MDWTDAESANAERTYGFNASKLPPATRIGSTTVSLSSVARRTRGISLCLSCRGPRPSFSIRLSVPSTATPAFLAFTSSHVTPRDAPLPPLHRFPDSSDSALSANVYLGHRRRRFSAIIGSAAFFGAVEWKTGRRDDPDVPADAATAQDVAFSAGFGGPALC